VYLEDVIRKRVRCCACEGSLAKGEINGVVLHKKAAWKFPVWNNILSPNKSPGALAFVCDKCIAEGRQPRFAVEFSLDGAVTYHNVTDLEDLEDLEETGGDEEIEIHS